MSATIAFDRAAGLTTIVTGRTLNTADRISLMDRVDESIRELESSHILLDVRQLSVDELPGVKNLVVQLGFRNFRMFALLGRDVHHETLRRIVQWFPFGNTMNVFSTPEDASEWLSLQARGIRLPRYVASHDGTPIAREANVRTDQPLLSAGSRAMAGNIYHPEHKHPPEYQPDLAPDASKGLNHGLDGAATPKRSANEIKQLHSMLTDFSPEELKQILVLSPGARLEAGAVYVNLADPRPHEIQALGDENVGEGDLYISKKDVPYQFWDRLIQDPTRRIHKPR